MLVLAFAETAVVAFAGIIVLGATIGTILMMQPLLISERFGVRDYPRIFSRTQLYTTFGTAGGPLLLGWLRDAAGGYRTSYIVAAVFSLVGAIVLSSSGPTTVASS
jgi:MFS family permease